MEDAVSLARRLARGVSPITVARGYVYKRQERVFLEPVDSSGLVATVSGSAPEPYVVELDWSRARQDRTVEAHCTCPSFSGGAICKHIWAVVVEADAQELEDAIPGSGPLRLVSLDPLDDLPDSDMDETRSQVRSGGSSRASAALRAKAGLGGRPGARIVSNWKAALGDIERSQQLASTTVATRSAGPARQRILYYIVDPAATRQYGRLVLDLYQSVVRRDGTPGVPRPANLDRRGVASIPDPEERKTLTLLLGMAAHESYGLTYSYGEGGYTPAVRRCRVPPELWETLLPRLCATRRLLIPQGGEIDPSAPLAWDEGSPWRFRLRLERLEADGVWRLAGVLEREGETADLGEPELLLASGCVILRRTVARLETTDAFEWISWLRDRGPVTIRDRDRDAFFERFWKLPRLPPVDWPADLPWEVQRCEPRPVLRLEVAPRPDATAPEGDARAVADTEPPAEDGRETPANGRHLGARLVVDYEGEIVDPGLERSAIADPQRRRVLERDRQGERAHREHLVSACAGLVLPTVDDWRFLVVRRELSRVVRALLEAGWRVEAEGQRLRRPGTFRFHVASGVDWFDLEADLEYEGTSVALPALLAALRRGDPFIELGDGTRGMLPEEWLARFAPVAEMARVADERLRFAPSQAALLDALLAAQSDGVTADATFERVRSKLRAFDGVRPMDAPPEFEGRLRDYQRLGLGWLEFLRDFGLGGCLADDMGLGKTVQVLALLEGRRGGAPPEEAARSAAAGGPAVRKTRRGSMNAHSVDRDSPDAHAPRLPSLVVVPRSLVHNWADEARRFTPGLRVLDYTGLRRRELLAAIPEHDLVVTTYGTLRRDILVLRDLEFDYAILDEAQAIKNPQSQSAKVCRLLRARHRLALTGTPVENRLDDLWSIFEFLNPGMLGASAVLRRFASAAERRGASADENGAAAGAALEILARAVRPYILRRTKEQVLKELPAKTEQTLHCEMDAKQRRLYVELRDHFRAVLGRHIEEKGLERTKIHVLEALLRLRQAACHPGLLDRGRARESSAKLETLLAQLQEVRAEGHKALVFSQFTRFLGIVRERLDGEGIPYQYLDGRTRDRKARIASFQEDPECPVFLISLKAGGLGLNLTAADYVFLLDPWWNPAVEGQAVDRAHRIGQERPVFVYRLLCRDTVEEKVLELQDRKRGLARSILEQDASFLRRLSAEDLRFLLG